MAMYTRRHSASCQSAPYRFLSSVFTPNHAARRITFRVLARRRWEMLTMDEGAETFLFGIGRGKVLTAIRQLVSLTCLRI